MQIRILAGRSPCPGCRTCSVLILILLFGFQVFDTSARGMNRQLMPTSEPSPMADFARMEAGEWRLGTVHATTWRWGPAHYSIRAHRVGSDIDLNPWRELIVWYSRPDLEQIHTLSFHPDIPGIGRGVGEGTIEFDGETAVASLELYQPGVRRKLESRWIFEGPDRFRDILLEDSGRGLALLAEWEYTRSMEPSSPPVPAAGRVPTPSRNIRAFVPFLGQWKGRKDDVAEHVRSSFQWIEHLDVIALRVEGASKANKPEHLLDEAYFYHHVGYDELRCLAISASGVVYEGGVTVLEDRDLELDLMRYEGDGSNRRLVRFEFAPDGTLRTREWSVHGVDRTLVLDISHRRTHEPQDD
jgi:hypothetical protein